MNAKEARQFFKGVALVRDGEKGIIPQRLTDRQLELYTPDKWDNNESIDLFARADAGVVIDVVCSSSALSFSFDTKYIRRRPYAIDVFENGHITKSFEYYEESGSFRYERIYGPDESHIEIYLSNIVYFELYDIDFGDAKPAPERKNKLLALGDSITMGMDGLHPSMLYGHQLARYYDADFHTTAVGAAVINPDIIDTDIGFKPNIITCAYGANDCAKIESVDEIIKNADGMYSNIVKCYPDAAVTVITPIWIVRMDKRYTEWYTDDYKEKFFSICDRLAALASEKYGFNVIRGLDIMPWDEHFYGDRAVHPDDNGFSIYTLGIIKNSPNFTPFEKKFKK